MAFGLTPEGFVAKTLEDVLAEVEAAQRGAIAADLDTSAETLVGQLNAAVCTPIAEVWELGEAVYQARSRRGAAAAQLDELGALTGALRRAASAGTVTLTVTLAAGATLPAGSVAHVAGQPTNRWVTAAPVTNGGGAPAAQPVAAVAETAGRVAANAGTVTAIATPVAGWTAVTNALDATPGRDADADPIYRLRQRLELARAGTSPLDALRADLLALADVDEVAVHENATDYVDAGGRPPHSVECVVRGGATAAAVALRIWQAKAAGIATHGSTSTTIVDASGASRVVWHTPAVVVPVWVTLRLAVDPNTYAGDAAVKAAVAAWGDANQRLGAPVLAARLGCVALDLAGVGDVAAVYLGTAPGPTIPGNLPVGPAEVAELDTTRVALEFAP